MENVLLQEPFWNLVFAVISSAAGAAVIALSFFRRDRMDISVMTFGATSLLYGLRLIVNTQLSQYTTTAPTQVLLYFSAFSTYLIPVPLSGFILNCFGRGWKDSIFWTFRGAIAFSTVGILSDIIQLSPGSLMRLNNGLVILFACVMLVNFSLRHMKQSGELRVVLGGFILFGLFALNENLVQLNLVPWSWGWEELGFAIFLGSIGYAAASRFFLNEARLVTIHREMEIARQIQSSILPRTLPTLPGLQLTARYIPMASVAGDFYDVLIQDDKRLCILIADVSGHGVGAALIASMLKVAFASQRPVLSDPAQVLAGINHALSDKLENNFVTAGCIFIDTNADTIQYASAGHPPMILHRRTEQKLSEFGDNGIILGPFPEAEYKSTLMHLESGDRLILYTDGIIETKSASGSFYGDRSFKTFIEAHGHLSTESFADTILQHLAQWSGKPSGESLDDDITLIVVDK